MNEWMCHAFIQALLSAVVSPQIFRFFYSFLSSRSPWGILRVKSEGNIFKSRVSRLAENTFLTFRYISFTGCRKVFRKMPDVRIYFDYIITNFVSKSPRFTFSRRVGKHGFEAPQPAKKIWCEWDQQFVPICYYWRWCSEAISRKIVLCQ